jgi:hypothetical protein
MSFPPVAGEPRYIGGYRIDRKIGEGGMGSVFLGSSPGGRAVAVKVIKPELAADPVFRARFRAEVSAVRKVGGFHTAPVVDADPEAEQPWMVSAFIPGRTLGLTISEDGPFGEGQLRALGAALAEALGAIHACRLVHRDLKPGNIIMAADGPRVLDFGIARAVDGTRLTHTGSVFGTAGFLAPEQIESGAEVGGACDVFALGAVLIAAAGGEAFRGATFMGLLYSTVHEEPDLSALPAALRPVVANCLAKNPFRRPTPTELIALLGHVPHSGPPPQPQPQFQPQPQSQPQFRAEGGDRGPERSRAQSVAPRTATSVPHPETVVDPAAAADHAALELIFAAARKQPFWRAACGVAAAVLGAVVVLPVLIYLGLPPAVLILAGLLIVVVSWRFAASVGADQSITFDEIGVTLAHRTAHTYIDWRDVVSVAPRKDTTTQLIFVDVTLRAGAPFPPSKGGVPKWMLKRAGNGMTFGLPGVVMTADSSAENDIPRQRLREAIRQLAPGVDVRRL